MTYTFYKAQGYAVGKSLVEEDKLELATSLIEKAKAKGVSLLLPTDIVIADKFAPDAESKVCSFNINLHGTNKIFCNKLLKLFSNHSIACATKYKHEQFSVNRRNMLICMIVVLYCGAGNSLSISDACINMFYRSFLPPLSLTIGWVLMLALIRPRPSMKRWTPPRLLFGMVRWECSSLRSLLQALM